MKERAEERGGKLFIPTGMKSEKEIFPGFSKREVIESIVALGVILLSTGIYYALSGDPNKAMFIIVFASGTALILIRKNENNQSAVGLTRNLINFFRTQRRYDYRRLDEWDD